VAPSISCKSRAVHILMPILFACATLLTSSAGLAQVFKCAGGNQQPVYQDQPCPAGHELRDFQTDPPLLSVIPLRPIPGTTSRVAVTPSGRVKSSPAGKGRAARTGDPAERRYIHPGMHEGEVIARIGAPDVKSGGGSRRLTRWTYMPTPADAQTLTTVVFDYGTVVEVERKVMK
jgi:hypothetical protein